VQGGKGVRNVGRGKGYIVCADARRGRERWSEKEYRRSRGDDKGQVLLRCKERNTTIRRGWSECDEGYNNDDDCNNNCDCNSDMTLI
jgi:hypothetical protein